MEKPPIEIIPSIPTVTEEPPTNLPDQPTTPEELKFSIDLFTAENPYSLINLLPREVADAIKRVKLEKPEYLEVDEREFRKQFASDGHTLNQTVHCIRIQFWQEYERAMIEQRRMKAAWIYGGALSRPNFYTIFLKNNLKVAWMVTPPLNYVTRSEEMLRLAQDKIRNILDADMKKFRTTQAQLSLMKLQFQVYQYLDSKATGAPVQKVAHLHHHMGKPPEILSGVTTTSDLDRKLKELERKERELIGKADERMGPGELVDEVAVETDDNTK